MQTWLVAIRKAKKMTQKDVCDVASIAQASYCNIELGKRRPSVPVAKRIAEILGFDWTRFYEEE